VNTPVPADESARLGALHRLQLLDREPNACFDRITRLAAGLFGVPIALVSFVDADRQWFGSRVGLQALETPRCDAFCAHTILEPEIMEIADATADARFAGNPLVSGDPRIRFYAGAPIASPDGYRLGTLCIIDRTPRSLDAAERQSLRDFADLVEREISLVDLALTDPLTGLANRRGLVEFGAQLVSLAHRRADPFSVLVADLDGLKQVNDAFGHHAGDRLIERAAAVLRGGLRRSDVLARVGGDEFTVLMYGTDGPGAAKVVTSLQHALDDHNQANPDVPPLAFSVGYATARPNDNIEGVIARADAAMYRNKRRTPRGSISLPERPQHSR
jgi:diguanylate cyclase (GGDEF)-like protein